LGHRNQKIFCDLGTLQHNAHKNKQWNRDQGIPLDIPIETSKIGHSGTEPLYGASLYKEGAGIACKQIPT
jgi:hypothetical protein